MAAATHKSSDYFSRGARAYPILRLDRESPVDSLLDQEKCSYATLSSRSLLTALYRH
jgi:hypothetical protein